MYKAIVLGDLHYPREADLFYKFLGLLEKEKPDYIFFCGDIINYANLFYLDKLLRKILRIVKAKIIGVMGNHDFWRTREMIRTNIYSEDIISMYKKVFRKYGAHLLWDEPYIADSFAVAGVPGWYDFSFASPDLDITIQDYKRGWFFGFQWNDALFVKFRVSPEKFVEINLSMLKKQLDELSKIRKRTYVLLHFVPIQDFIAYRHDIEDVWNAYAGSPKFGDLIMRYSFIKQVFFGHFNPKYLTSKVVIKNGVKFVNVDISHGLESIEIIYV